jgi:hypothetical protein
MRNYKSTGSAFEKLRFNMYGIFTMDALDNRPDNSAFFVSGIRPETGFDLPDIRLDTGYRTLK